MIALEERGAELLGHEEAVFVPTATMANQIALAHLTEPGDEAIVGGAAHIFCTSSAAPAVHSGLVMKSLETEDGRFTAAQLREAVNPSGDLHMAPTASSASRTPTTAGAGGSGRSARCGR